MSLFEVIIGFFLGHRCLDLLSEIFLGAWTVLTELATLLINNL